MYFLLFITNAVGFVLNMMIYTMAPSIAPLIVSFLCAAAAVASWACWREGV